MPVDELMALVRAATARSCTPLATGQDGLIDSHEHDVRVGSGHAPNCALRPCARTGGSYVSKYDRPYARFPGTVAASPRHAERRGTAVCAVHAVDAALSL